MSNPYDFFQADLRRPDPLPPVSVPSKSLVIVGNTNYFKGRLVAAVLNYTRFCRCERCDSCLAGKAYLAKFPL